MRARWIACVALLCLAAPAWATNPLNYTRATLEQARAIVSSDRTHDDKLAALSGLFRKFLDTDVMGREALGSHWTSFTPSQQKGFLALFRKLFERTYVQKLLLFERPKFAYVRETIMDGQSRVDTKIITPRDDFDVVYRFRSNGDGWLATRISVENVNLTANLGSQLDNLLAKISVQDLLDLMQRKYGDRTVGNQP